jgi:hypothetical protein
MRMGGGTEPSGAKAAGATSPMMHSSSVTSADSGSSSGFTCLRGRQPQQPQRERAQRRARTAGSR